MACYKIAGYHDLYWRPFDDANAYPMGITGPDGLETTKDEFLFDITGDALGPETIIDGVYQGANVTVSMTLQDIKLDIVKRFLNPFTENQESSPISGRPESVGAVGSLACTYKGSLYAIPRTGTPAASLNASGGNGRRWIGVARGPRVESLDARPRFIPIMFQAYPFATIDDRLVWWEWVTPAPTA